MRLRMIGSVATDKHRETAGTEGMGKAVADKKCGSVADTNSVARQGGVRASSAKREREPNAKRSEHRGGKPRQWATARKGGGHKGSYICASGSAPVRLTERRISMSGSEDTDRICREIVPKGMWSACQNERA